MRLLVFGPGYSASAVIARLRGRCESIVATARTSDRANALEANGIRPVAFDGSDVSTELADTIGDATHILVSIAPGESGDPVLGVAAGEIASAPNLRAVTYLSTVGVYGDHRGEWVDEATQPLPKSRRSLDRLAAEQSWTRLAEEAGKRLAILRLAGIYGSGRNALINLANGTARRVVKQGQLFNRISVDDIAAAVDAAVEREASGVFNVTDDEPAPPQAVLAFAAGLMSIDPPPEIPFGEADLSPIARSFYGENKRVRNTRLKQSLGIALAYPTYREGLTALWNAGEGRATQSR